MSVRETGFGGGILQPQPMRAVQVAVAAVQRCRRPRREHRTPAERRHPARQRAGQPGEDIKVVAALFQQVAAGEFAKAAPVAVKECPLGGTQVLVRLDAHYPAQVAAIYARLDPQVERCVAQHEADEQVAVGGACRVPDRLTVGHRGRHRLLAEYVLAMLESGHRGLAMGVVGRGHHHQVDVVALHDLPVTGDHLRPRVQFVAYAPRGIGARVVERGEPRATERLEPRQNVPPARPAAHRPDTQLTHGARSCRHGWREERRNVAVLHLHDYSRHGTLRPPVGRTRQLRCSGFAADERPVVPDSTCPGR